MTITEIKQILPILLLSHRRAGVGDPELVPSGLGNGMTSLKRRQMCAFNTELRYWCVSQKKSSSTGRQYLIFVSPS